MFCIIYSFIHSSIQSSIHFSITYQYNADISDSKTGSSVKIAGMSRHKRLQCLLIQSSRIFKRQKESWFNECQCCCTKINKHAGWPNELISACRYSNGNSCNASCSKPSLHCRKRPWEGALYKWLTKSASDAMHKALYKWTTFTFTY